MLHPAICLTEDKIIHGKGLITTTFIPVGAVIWQRETWMETVELAQFQTWSPEKQDEFQWFAFQCSADELLLCEGIDRYMNHSCTPNTWWQDDSTLVACRDISSGEEVTYDYASTEISLDFSMQCSCGSAHCRGLVTSKDYRNPAWQAQYAEHLPSFVLDAIKANTG